MVIIAIIDIHLQGESQYLLDRMYGQGVFAQKELHFCAIHCIRVDALQIIATALYEDAKLPLL